MTVSTETPARPVTSSSRVWAKHLSEDEYNNLAKGRFAKLGSVAAIIGSLILTSGMVEMGLVVVSAFSYLAVAKYQHPIFEETLRRANIAEADGIDTPQTKTFWPATTMSLIPWY